MQSKTVPMYDIGDLKNDPEQLYDLAVMFRQFFECRTSDQSAEIWEVLERVSASLWGNLPPVLTIDFRDPDDPKTWGEFGPPCSASEANKAGTFSAALARCGSGPTPPDKLPDLYSLADLSALFGVSKSTVSRWFKRGLIPCVRIGGRLYAEYNDLLTAIKQGKISQSVIAP